MIMTDEASDASLNRSVSQLEFEGIGLTTDNSYGKLINETIDLLLASCNEDVGPAVIHKIFANIQVIGCSMYINKKVMGRAGALESIYRLFKATVGDNSVSTEGCKAVRCLIVGENENKRIFGSLGICQLMCSCLSTIKKNNISLMLLVLQVMIDLCNPALRSKQIFEIDLKQKGYKPKGAAYFENIKKKTSQPLEVNIEDFTAPPEVEVERSLDYVTCNNRLNFYNAGICRMLCDNLREFIGMMLPSHPEFAFKPHGKLERAPSLVSTISVSSSKINISSSKINLSSGKLDIEVRGDSVSRLVPSLSLAPLEVLPVMMPSNIASVIGQTYHFIGVLAENDSLSKGFGFHGITEIVFHTFHLHQYILKEDVAQLNSYVHIFNHAAWSIVVLCSDIKAHNKRYCNEISLAFHIVSVLLFFAQSSVNTACQANAEYHQMMERLLWAVLVMTRHSTGASAEITSIAPAKDLLENIISGEYKANAKGKAKELFKQIYPQ